MVPAFEIAERITKQEKIIRDQTIQQEKEEAIKKVNVEFVKNARKKGFSVDVISELTGLAPEEIKKIK